MKILFAVSNENVSNKIVDSYRKKYGEAVSFKSVFYFNAIIREIQKDKTYDRIVISEDLEPFSNNNYDIIDKFIIERLREISYETKEQKIDVVVICTDRRTKSSYVLTKMYEYGIYNALIGTDRRIDNVCDLIQNPRTEAEAREYYNIEAASNEENSIEDVSEQEVQNILIHYKRLGKNEERYADSFNNIAAQYTDKQLKIIIKCLPINVRAVLEAECPKYQELVTYAEETAEEKKQKEKIQEQRKLEQLENDRKLKDKIEKEKREAIRNAQKNQDVTKQPQTAQQSLKSGIDLLDNKRREAKMTGNVIIPNSMNIRNERKIYSEEELAQMDKMPRQGRMGNIQTSEVKHRVSESPKMQDEIYPNIEEESSRVRMSESSQADTLPGFEDLESENTKVIENNMKIKEEETILPGLEDIDLPKESPIGQAQIQMEEVASQPEVPQAPKKGRGRPRKYPEAPPKPKGKRGRPRKNPLPEENVEEETVLPGISEIEKPEEIEKSEVTSLPGFEDFDIPSKEETATTLPGIEDVVLPGLESDTLPGLEDDVLPGLESNTLPGFEDFDIPSNQETATTLPGIEDVVLPGLESDTLPGLEDDILPGLESNTLPGLDENNIDYDNQEPKVNTYSSSEERREAIQKLEANKTYQTGSLNTVLTKDKKVVAFVGASKSGTSFLINNLACLFSSIGVKTAILDMTQNKNSYYIYTNNDENLRNIAYNSIENLENGIAEGIKVDRNLEVYTAMPNDGKDYSNAEAILSTLVQNESLVLIDCDFDTYPGYFANAQEIYLVQSMDILTIQPLTAFLRELKTMGILEQEKLRVVINKELKVKSLSTKAVIGGMSFYNDPAMSYMTELFSKDKVKACTIPFDENVYSRYLEAMVNCVISINGYTKGFMNSLKILGNMVYPLLSKQTYTPKTSAEMSYGNNFSTEMNNTLNQMRNKY